MIMALAPAEWHSCIVWMRACWSLFQKYATSVYQMSIIAQCANECIDAGPRLTNLIEIQSMSWQRLPTFIDKAQSFVVPFFSPLCRSHSLAHRCRRFIINRPLRINTIINTYTAWHCTCIRLVAHMRCKMIDQSHYHHHHHHHIKQQAIALTHQIHFWARRCILINIMPSYIIYTQHNCNYFLLKLNLH